MVGTRILVCGGRDYNNKDRVWAVLDTFAREYSRYYVHNDNWLPTDIVIIHGAAKGADSLADSWAVHNHAQIDKYVANWKKYGKSAGYRRNMEMLVDGDPDMVIAFPGGKGTAMMIKIAEEAGVRVVKIDS